MDWKRLVQFALLGSSEFGTICHPAGTRFARVLRHLRDKRYIVHSDELLSAFMELEKTLL